ncbi:MAG TPA: S8 family serine peptidase [Thermoanaerobaculia bacterium]|nr:S8 family serine peptidase [Thermoanaerobaculia bacterium]
MFRLMISAVVFTLLLPAATFAAPPSEGSTGRYMIEFADFAGAAEAVRAAGGSPVHVFPDLSVVAAYLPQRAYQALSANPNVRLIAEDPKRYPFAQEVPYGIPMVQADLLSDGAASNRKVCIIDSGFYTGHEDLTGNAVNGTNNTGTGNWYTDKCGHGTHVAGTVAAINNTTGVVGVLPNGKVNLHIIKVFGDDCAWAYSSDLIAALDACRKAGSNIVSMSLGGGKPIGPWEQNAFDSAYSAGVLSIAAAGNAGNTAYSYPASHNSVVSVAALDSNKLVADFSQKNDQVELAAPGVAVLSTVPYLEENTLSADGVTWSGGHIAASPRTSGTTGILADGSTCESVGSWTGQVVLCQRGNISFRDKVENARLGGAVAVAIYNNVSGGFLGTCDDGTGTSCSIPAISLSDTDGAAAKTKVGLSGTVVSKITQPASGYEAWNGTSMATPHVSGVAALVWSHNTTWTNDQIRKAMQATAEDLGAAGKDNSYGYGLVRARAALCHLDPNQTACGGGGTVNSPPSANFTFTTSQLAASFTDTSTDSDGSVTGWSWAFGDGATSTQQHPSHTYAAAGTYTVQLTVTDNGGATGSTSQSVTVSTTTTTGITLSATGYKVKGVHHADLTWSGATSTSVDVWRNGSKITTTANDGAHTDNIGLKGSGTYTYKVCEAGTTTCSNEATVTF